MSKFYSLLCFIISLTNVRGARITHTPDFMIPAKLLMLMLVKKIKNHGIVTFMSDIKLTPNLL